MQIRAVLFDLDGTLLQNDMDVFITHFLRRLAPHLTQYASAEQVVKAWQSSMQSVMAHNDGGLTNQQVFDMQFYSRIGALQRDVQRLVDVFYATSYRSLRNLVRPQPGARETIQAMRDARLDIVIATNPIFPHTAIMQRLEWADLADLDFRLITSADNMHSTKPMVAYYQEILAALNYQPAECLMIGDDFINDIRPANRIGMRTYWVNTTTTTPPNFDPKSRGHLHQFYSWLVQMGLLQDQF